MGGSKTSSKKKLKMATRPRKVSAEKTGGFLESGPITWLAGTHSPPSKIPHTIFAKISELFNNDCNLTHKALDSFIHDSVTLGGGALRTLHCTDGQLITLPRSVGLLANLETLVCSFNSLTYLPESIGQLAHLTTLRCINNHIASLPESVGQLACLKTLECTNNSLKTLPESIGRLARLEQLRCSRTKLKSLPESI